MWHTDIHILVCANGSTQKTVVVGGGGERLGEVERGWNDLDVGGRVSY